MLGSGNAKAHLTRSLKNGQGKRCLKKNRMRQHVVSVIIAKYMKCSWTQRSLEGCHREDAFKLNPEGTQPKELEIGNFR